MRVMTTNHEMYSRLIRCIVLNSFKNIFDNNGDIPETIVHICLSAMSSKSTDIRDRVAEFNYIVKVYRAKILRDCQRYSEVGEDIIIKLETPKQETQARVFEYLDANRNEFIKPDFCTGKLPTTISTSALQEVAQHVLGTFIDSNSNDKCERNMYWALRTMAIKWWQSRINASNASHSVENPLNPSTHQDDESENNQLPLKKRRYTKALSSSRENEPPSNVVQDYGETSSDQVFWVRSDKHFRSLMRLQKKKQKKQNISNICKK